MAVDWVCENIWTYFKGRGKKICGQIVDCNIFLFLKKGTS